MFQSRSKKIPNAEWSKHEREILSLYVDDERELKGKGGVIEVMKEKHGFVASDAQYEYRLKKWGARKYVSKDDWKSIHENLDLRELFNKESEVYIDGRRVPLSKLERERRRYQNDNSFSTSPDLRLALSDRIHIRTPPPMPFVSGNQSANFMNHACSSSSQPSSEAPINTSAFPTFPTGVSDMQCMTHAHPFVSGTNDSLILLSPMGFTSGSDTSSMLPHGFPESIFANGSSSQYSWKTNVTQAFRPWTKGPVNLVHILGSINKNHLANLTTFARQTISTEAFASVSQLMHAPATSLYLRDVRQDLQLLYTLLSALANDLIPIPNLENPRNVMEEQLKHLILSCNKMGKSEFSRMLRWFPEPLQFSLARGLFLAAIAVGAGQVVDTILDEGFDPNDAVFVSNYGIETWPFLYACENGYPLIAKSIASKMAHTGVPTFTMRNIKEGIGSILTVDHDNTIEIVKLLLRNDYFLNPSFIEGLLHLNQPDISRMLISHLPVDKRILLYQKPCLEALFSSCTHQFATDIAVFLSNPEWCMSLSNDENRVQACLKNALNRMLEFGHLRAAEITIQKILAPDSVNLYHAIQAGSVVIAQDLLDRGVPANVCVKEDFYGLRGVPSHVFPEEDFSGLERERNYRKTEWKCPLAAAFRSYSMDIIQRLHAQGSITSGMQISVLESCTYTACKTGRVNLLKFLLSKCNQLDTRNLSYPNYQRMPISAAIHNHHEEMVPVIISHGLIPSVKDFEEALLHQKFDTAEFMLDYVLGYESCGMALHLAIRAHHCQIISSIINSGQSWDYYWEPIPYSYELDVCRPKWPFNIYGVSPFLSTAILSGCDEVVDQLLDMGAPLNYKHSSPRGRFISPLLAAVHVDQSHLVSQLLSRGANPADEEPMLEAVSKNNPDMLEVLINAFQSRNSNFGGLMGPKSLIAAINNGNYLMIQKLALITDVNVLTRMDKGSDQDISAFGAAIEYGGLRRLEIIKFLMSNGADSNRVAKRNYYTDRFPLHSFTPLLLAIAMKDIETIQLLVAAGANIHDIPCQGIRYAPIQAAVRVGALGIVEYLLQHDVDVNSPPTVREGRTALQLAAENGFIGIAHLLIRRGADVNAPRATYSGRTAFEAAAEKRRIEMLMYLVEQGADIVSDGGEQYRNSLFLAKSNRHKGISQYVEQVYSEQCIARSMETGASLAFGTASYSNVSEFDPILCQF